MTQTRQHHGEEAAKAILRRDESAHMEQLQLSGEYQLYIGLRCGYSATDEYERAQIQELCDTMHLSDIIAKLRA